ncbi:PLP-dependent transferase [Lophiostoma macrostomum CBS 122681]|uniref:PLP-dependent transferase n=1 Tax=Lophiostoma macrostomum CBS 122681 TaxID=1314788 RepID=A0A6A6T7X1_9PLEO|nr:PLP-dependent transferase [Lophiostoma macrostomum CBS 122681]
MAPARITSPSVEDGDLHRDAGYATVQDAIEAAKARFVQRNPESLRLHQEALKSLPGGNTRSLLHTTPFPVFVKEGKGYQVVSEDGHTYTDFLGEMTAALYGHSQPAIQKSLINTINNVGLNLGATTKLEAQHASLICSRFHLDRVRFTNSGTEANLHAIQGARRFTGKRKIVVFGGGYHGACFMFPEDAPAENVVDASEFIVAEYNDNEDTRVKIEESGNVAAVLVEGMQGAGPCIVGTHAFLHQIQESARKVGAVFILDEVMTSRLAPGGLQELEDLEPDMTTMGKYLGGGITFGCFGGKEQIMRVYDPRDGKALAHSGTFNNNTLGMVAGYTGLSQVYTPEVCCEFNRMGDRFREKLQAVSKGTKMAVMGRGSLLGLHFLENGRKELKNYSERKENGDLKELLWLELMEDGYWTHKRGSISLMLDTPEEELDRYVACVAAFLRRHAAMVKL